MCGVPSHARNRFIVTLYRLAGILSSAYIYLIDRAKVARLMARLGLPTTRIVLAHVLLVVAPCHPLTS
jgi:hypothetical protein